MALDKTEQTLHQLDRNPKEMKVGKGAGKGRSKNKTDRFLRAIKKYANEQKSAMKSEIKELKAERLKAAEDQAKRESEQMIQEKLSEARSRETVILASKTKEGQKKLFIARSEMVDDVFEKAAQKLIDYTKTDAYHEKLMESAKAIAEIFGDNDCALYVNERDMKAADQIKSIFGGNAAITADDSIRIGGIKGNCKSLHIIADETLDSKLEAQREWFVENAALSVL